MALGRNLIKASRKAERKTAREVGGRTQPASGATAFAKGDIVNKQMLIERKDTWAASYTLKLEDLRKIRDHAVKADKLPVFQIAYNHDGAVREYAVVEWAVLLDLLGIG